MLTTMDVALVVFFGKELFVFTNCARAFKGFWRVADMPVREKVVIEMFFARADNYTRLTLKDLLNRTSGTPKVATGNGAVNGALNGKIDW